MALACAAPMVALAEPVNINTADARTIAKELKGIGVARAQAIVAYRTQHGPFKSADDLGLVKGIAQKVIDENRPNIRVDGSRSANSAGKQEPPKSAAAKPITAPERLP
jgi:competence protein ComEA